MGKLAELPNIGKVLEERLIQAGIETEDRLREVGSKQACLIVN